MKLTHEEKCEAWKKTGIFRLGWHWCHSWTGRLFLPGTSKFVWCEEMNERYGSFD